ncbi:MAG: hypothetical protein J6X16_09850 [Bacteroidales bacterium]|nr:hypothetical protein [Bacteroidales bacterium]
MKTLKLMLSIVCATVLLTSGQVFGQNKGERADIMSPAKADNYKEIAAKLTEEGWKTSAYTIEEQLVSTAKLKGEVSPVTHDALYLWVMEETTAADLAKAKETNNMDAVNSLTYQVALPFLSQCQILLIQKGATDKMKALNQIVNQITPMIVQNNIVKSMEITLEKDKSAMVRTVFLLNKDKVYDILVEECIHQAEGVKENAILIEFFKEAHHRMAKRSIR